MILHCKKLFNNVLCIKISILILCVFVNNSCHLLSRMNRRKWILNAYYIESSFLSFHYLFSGMTVDELLSNNDFRQKLNSLYQKYAKCISIVETGQFKRSIDPQLLPNDSTELETPAENQSAGALQRWISLLPLKTVFTS